MNFSLPITEQSKAKPMQFWLTFATHLNFLNIEIGVDQLTGKRLLFTLVLHTGFFFFFFFFWSVFVFTRVCTYLIALFICVHRGRDKKGYLKPVELRDGQGTVQKNLLPLSSSYL